MRILQGKKVVEAPTGWRESIDAAGRSVVIDLGAGDGRYAYERARVEPETLYVAVDPDPETMADYAFRASRKPARGGVENAVFVVAAVESLPPELKGIATLVRVNFPWGSLMRGLLEPQPAVLDAIALLLSSNGDIEVITSYHPEHDTNAFAGDSLPPLDDAYIQSTLVPAYEAAGFNVTDHRRMTQDEALNVPSTWGRRLLHARPRDVYFLALQPVPAEAR
jgi:16S rRNA (adenine(1408)-N(1))-methyltransferase